MMFLSIKKEKDMGLVLQGNKMTLKKTFSKFGKKVKVEYSKSKSKYKTYNSAPKLGQRKLTKIKKKYPLKKVNNHSRKVSKNIQYYFDKSTKDMKRL